MVQYDSDGEEQKPSTQRMMRPIWVPGAFSAWIFFALLCGVSGPFDTFLLFPLLLRTLFWAVVIGASILVLHVWRGILVQVIGPGKRRRFDAAMIGGMVLAIWSIAGFALWLLAPWAREPAPGPGLIALYAFSATALTYSIRRIWPGVEDPRYTLAFQLMSESPEAGQPHLLDRLAPQSVTVQRLEADGHFVAIVGEEGQERLRMRFADAVGEMAPVQGIWTHRSHWVVISAVRGAERVGGKLWIVMENGDRVPVSRKYQPNVADAGLLAEIHDVAASESRKVAGR